jgi:hypothetical protein
MHRASSNALVAPEFHAIAAFGDFLRGLDDAAFSAIETRRDIIDESMMPAVIDGAGGGCR